MLGGDFLTPNFDEAEWFCGTGAVVHDDKIIFATPTGMHAGIFMISEGARIVLSNSLSLLMAKEGYTFDSCFIGYEKFFKNKSFQTINDEAHIVWKNSEVGLSESHLHQGYIPVPMTSYGIRHWTDLFRISNSDEMKPWSIGGDYDRLIPRRILEEKGLPRESFGMKKYGAEFFYAYDWKNASFQECLQHQLWNLKDT